MSTTRAIGRFLIAAALTATSLTAVSTVASAVPVDINPDTSDNANANASSGGRVNHMGSTPNDNQTFYLASEYGGLFKSTDGGNGWSHLDGHLPVIGWDVEVDPTAANRVYASSWYDGRVDSLSGINVSTDAGATWSHPATGFPDPALEGTANDNTPDPAYSCTNSRTEPSAFGISIDPNSSGPVAIGTRCGVALSTDLGATWAFRDPTPATPANVIWDTYVHPGGSTIDVCGVGGHYRSIDGGTTWNGGTGGLPSGRCSITVSPDESYVVIVVASDNQVYESDDAGATWTNLGNNGAQGRIPFVVANQRSDDGDTDRFDLWYADTQLFRGACVTPDPAAIGGAARCPNAATWSNNQTGAHWDGGDLLFDTEDADGIDACPVLFSSDGGVHTRTGGSCESPTWSRSNVGYHGTWLWTMDGEDDASSLAAEELYYGMQDNGTMATTNAGATPPTWTNPNCCDTFDMLAGPTWVLGTSCCFTMGRQNQLQIAGAGYAGPTQVNTYPAGTIPGFTWGHRLAQFGTNAVAMITTSGLFSTPDITANPIVWSAMTALPADPGTPCDVRTSLSGGTWTFFVQTGQCTGRGPDRLYRMDGTGGVWNRIDDDAGAGGIGIFGADPTDPNNIYISQDPLGTPSMMRSTDGGTTWDPDPELDQMMTGNGVFKYLNSQGPSTNRGGAGAAFQGYPQPMLVQWSAEDPGVLVAGGADSGVFLSVDSGDNWSLVTDPFTPATSGSAHLPRPRYAYFDSEPASGFDVYIGTQGRGVWRLAFEPPTADAGGPYVTPEGTDVVLSAAGSSGSSALTYAWDLDDDGVFDDATGVSPTFTEVGQDGVFDVAVKVTDADGAYDIDATTVTVTNVAPTIDTLDNSGPVDENTAVTVSGTASDPGWLDPLTVTIDWGDGPEAPDSAVVENVRPDATVAFSASHTYGDNGTFSVEVCVADDDTQTCDTTDVVVDNVDPTAVIDESGATIVNGVPTFVTSIGDPLDVPVHSDDPGSDDLTFTWDWDDAQPDDVQTSLVDPPSVEPPVPPTPSPEIDPRSVDLTATHTYTEACLYDLVVTVVRRRRRFEQRQHRRGRGRRCRVQPFCGLLVPAVPPAAVRQARCSDAPVLPRDHGLHEHGVRRGTPGAHDRAGTRTAQRQGQRPGCRPDLRPPTAGGVAQLRQRRRGAGRTRGHQWRRDARHHLLGGGGSGRGGAHEPRSQSQRPAGPEGRARANQPAGRWMMRLAVGAAVLVIVVSTGGCSNRGPDDIDGPSPATASTSTGARTTPATPGTPATPTADATIDVGARTAPVPPTSWSTPPPREPKTKDSVGDPPDEPTPPTTTVPPSTTDPGPPTTPGDDIVDPSFHAVVVAGGDPAQAASSLHAVVGCGPDDPGIPFAQLGWTRAIKGGDQRVQVTIDPRGFETDTTRTSHVVTAGTSMLRWTQVSGQAIHRWRVLTADGSRWVASKPAEFEGPLCAVDERTP